MIILILDYGSGNIRSVYNSIMKTSSKFNKSLDVRVSNKLSHVKQADKIILPGVGSFDKCMNGLHKNKNLIGLLNDQIINKNKPFLGICVGMQILADFGFENKKTQGLSWIKGDVKNLKYLFNHTKDIKIPHMGWNNLNFNRKNKMFKSISKSDQFYFVHSYYFDVKHKEDIISNTYYGIEIPAIINKKNIYGFQFHPEKSGTSGINILYDWLNLS